MCDPVVWGCFHVISLQKMVCRTIIWRIKRLLGCGPDWSPRLRQGAASTPDICGFASLLRQIAMFFFLTSPTHQYKAYHWEDHMGLVVFTNISSDSSVTKHGFDIYFRFFFFFGSCIWFTTIIHLYKLYNQYRFTRCNRFTRWFTRNLPLRWTRCRSRNTQNTNICCTWTAQLPVIGSWNCSSWVQWSWSRNWMELDDGMANVDPWL